MDYLDVFQAMLADMRSDLRHWQRGNKAEYLYRPEADPDAQQNPEMKRLCQIMNYASEAHNKQMFDQAEAKLKQMTGCVSRRDAGAPARLRLCYALADSEKPVAEREEIVRTLFDAECTAAEQLGKAGAALPLLTEMLKAYEPADSPLLARAKQYGSSGCTVKPFELYTIEDCLKAAADTGMHSYLFTLLLCASRSCDAETLRSLQERYQMNGRK